MSIKWVRIQQQYLQLKGSINYGKRWDVALIKKLWDVAWDQWDDRNSTLHETPLAINLSGTLSIDRSIEENYSQGSVGLPMRVRLAFPDNIQQLLSASIAEQQF